MTSRKALKRTVHARAVQSAKFDNLLILKALLLALLTSTGLAATTTTGDAHSKTHRRPIQVHAQSD